MTVVYDHRTAPPTEFHPPGYVMAADPDTVYPVGEPNGIIPGQFWFDETNGLIKQRNDDNDGWDTFVIKGAGLDLSVPGPIGGTTPNTGAFTNLSASGTVSFTSGLATISGTINPFLRVLASGAESGFFQADVGVVNIGAGSNHPLHFYTNATSRGYITADGTLFHLFSDLYLQSANAAITIGDGTGAPRTAYNGAAAVARGAQWYTAGSQRWAVYANGDAESGSNAGSNFVIIAADDASSPIGEALRITRSSMNATFGANLSVTGALSKGSGTFLIDHPLDPANKDLYHAFVEAPRYDLIYRGNATLVDGAAEVNIDLHSNMTPGTFEALTQNPTVFVTGVDGLTYALSGATLTITGAADVNVSWLVIAERADAFIMDVDNTDTEGHLIPEHNKPDATQWELDTGFMARGKKGYPRHIESFDGYELPEPKPDIFEELNGKKRGKQTDLT